MSSDETCELFAQIVHEGEKLNYVNLSRQVGPRLVKFGRKFANEGEENQSLIFIVIARETEEVVLEKVTKRKTALNIAAGV